MNQTEHSLKSLPRTFAKRNVRLEIYRMMRNAERQRLMRSAPASVIADLSGSSHVLHADTHCCKKDRL